MYYYADRTYADWQGYLANGRKKYERTLYDRGYRIQYANKFNKSSDIQIVMPWVNNYPLITVHPDDTKTIQSPGMVTTAWGGTWDPLRAYSVRFTIWKYAGVEVVQRNFKFKLYEQNAQLTPPKIQGCRMCKQSGKVELMCHPPTCWNGELDDNGVYKCPDHPSAVQQHKYSRWHSTACSHGSDTYHTIPKGQMCYSCNGVGKRDYGSQRISVPWDGSPIKVQEGNIVRKPLTELERIVASYVGPTLTV
jgi:hypothetical protein